MSYSKRIIRNELAKAWANALNNLELDLNIVRVSFCEGFDAGEVYRKEQHDNFLNEHRLERERSQKLFKSYDASIAAMATAVDNMEQCLAYESVPTKEEIKALFNAYLDAIKAYQDYKAGEL